ncbi:MAG: transglutaminase-like cysteine peptidase [Proteobacteria bacterium]|nr:transglutaminase-like cysteine peptidase [Pseudomonadota bacterium]
MFNIKIAVALFGLGCLFSNVANAELFGSSEKKSRNINLFPKWVKMLERLQEDEDYCIRSKTCLVEDMVTHIKKKSINYKRYEVLAEVNSLVNRFKYVDDYTKWKKDDHWSTPTEFFKGGGDCEDYAIAKFKLLKKLGFKNENMRVVVLSDTFNNIKHSVLVVFIDEKKYLLDNDISRVIETKEISHYKPIFSINETHWWKHSI